MKKILIALSTLVLTTACQTGGKGAFQHKGQYNTLEKGAENVEVTRDEVAKSCKLIDSVIAGGNLGESQRIVYLKNKAASMGGDTVSVNEKNLLRTVGNVYKCH